MRIRDRTAVSEGIGQRELRGMGQGTGRMDRTARGQGGWIG